MFGFAKGFAIMLIVSLVIAYGTRSIKTGLSFLIFYIIVKMVWRLLTGGKK